MRSNKGKPLSEEHKAKLRAAHLGRKLSQEHKRKIAEGNRGKTVSQETKDKISKANNGRRHTPETRRKMSIAMMGKQNALGHRLSDESKAKISKNNGSRDPEVRAKMSAAAKGRTPWNKGKKTGQTPWNKGKTGVYSEETRRKMGDSCRGRKLSQKQKDEISRVNRAFWRKPENRKKRQKYAQDFWDNNQWFRKETSERFKKMWEDPAHREKMLAILQKMAGSRGTMGTFWSDKNGKYVTHRSQLEMGMYQILERLHTVVRYQVEPVRITYTLNGRKHTYIPDLIVEYDDGTCDLIEVKPSSLVSTETNKAKFAAARRWCRTQRRSFAFHVWTNKRIKREAIRCP